MAVAGHLGASAPPRECSTVGTRSLQQGLEVRAKYPLDLGDCVRVEESFMTEWDDRFGLGAVEMAARKGDHAVSSCMHWSRNLLTDDAMKGNCRWNRRQGHQRRTIAGEGAN